MNMPYKPIKYACIYAVYNRTHCDWDGRLVERLKNKTRINQMCHRVDAKITTCKTACKRKKKKKPNARVRRTNDGGGRGWTRLLGGGTAEHGRKQMDEKSVAF